MVDHIAFLELVVFFLGGGDHHASVGTIDFEEDGHLVSETVGESGLVPEPLVLRVLVLLEDELVHDKARVTKLDDLSLFGPDFKVFGEALWQHAPNAIGVELERETDLIDEMLGCGNDLGTDVSDHGGHLHGVPPSALSHNVAVK